MPQPCKGLWETAAGMGPVHSDEEGEGRLACHCQPGEAGGDGSSPEAHVSDEKEWNQGVLPSFQGL